MFYFNGLTKSFFQRWFVFVGTALYEKIKTHFECYLEHITLKESFQFVIFKSMSIQKPRKGDLSVRAHSFHTMIHLHPFSFFFLKKQTVWLKMMGVCCPFVLYLTASLVSLQPCCQKSLEKWWLLMSGSPCTWTK